MRKYEKEKKSKEKRLPKEEAKEAFCVYSINKWKSYFPSGNCSLKFARASLYTDIYWAK